MARTIDTVTVELITNGSQPKQQLAQINKALTETKRKMTEAFEKGDAKAYKKYSQEAAKLEKQQREILSRTQSIRNSLERLDKATPKQLRQAIKEINSELNSGAVERGAEEWKRLTDALRKAKGELKDIQTESKAASEGIDPPPSFTKKITDWGNKWLGAYTIAKDAIGRLYSSMQGYVADYAEMAEHMASVTKYTGLATEDVEELNEAFKQMDTRTSREALNDLAADAGRLGIQSKQEILDFVAAADTSASSSNSPSHPTDSHYLKKKHSPKLTNINTKD